MSTKTKAPAVEFAPVTFGRRPSANALFGDNEVIMLNPALGGLNPKRGKARDRFARYADGMTVAEYIKAVVDGGEKPGVARADLKYDTDKGLVAITPPVAESPKA